jgi:hypothetical protein
LPESDIHKFVRTAVIEKCQREGVHYWTEAPDGRGHRVDTIIELNGQKYNIEHFFSHIRNELIQDVKNSPLRRPSNEPMRVFHDLRFKIKEDGISLHEDRYMDCLKFRNLLEQVRSPIKFEHWLQVLLRNGYIRTNGGSVEFLK